MVVRERDRGAVEIGDRFDRRQSQAAARCRAAGIQAIEAVEHLLAFFRRDARPGTGNPQRLRHAVPRINRLGHWLQVWLNQISGKSALTDAIRYGITRLARLRPYLEDGRLA